MEKFQTDKKIICLNSKIDFIKPFKTHLTIQTGNLNERPGVPERQKRKFEDRQKDRPIKRVRTDTKTEFKRMVQTQRCSTPAPDTSGVDNLDLSNILCPEDHSSAKLPSNHQSREQDRNGTSKLADTNKAKRKQSDPEFCTAQSSRKIRFNLPDQLWDDSRGINS